MTARDRAAAPLHTPAVASASNGDGIGSAIDRSRAELSAAVQETEAGILAVIDRVGRISGSLDAIGGPACSEIRAHCTAILEACAFQDIVGQRLVKIGDLLSRLQDGGPDLCEQPDSHEVRGPLNGPALIGEGLNQEEIERLFEEPFQAE
jgi:hypothetical protein